MAKIMLSKVMIGVSSRSKCQVLIVDDCVFLRTAVAGLLGVDECITVAGQASNGAEGLRLTASLRPDIVVTDLEMPVMDGAEFIAQQLKKRFLPMIIFSAVRMDSPLAIRARQGGAVAHIAKPAGIADVMGQHQLLRQEILSAYHRS